MILYIYEQNIQIQLKMTSLFKDLDQESLKRFVPFLWKLNNESNGASFENPIAELINESMQFREDHFVNDEGTKIWRWESNETIQIHHDDRSGMWSLSKVYIVLWFDVDDNQDPSDIFELSVSIRVPYVKEQIIEKSFFSSKKIDIIGSQNLEFSVNPFSSDKLINKQVIDQIDNENGGIVMQFIYTLYDKIAELIVEAISEFYDTKGVKENIFSELDKDNNGVIDVIEGEDDFMQLLKKHQEKISEYDKAYLQKFVKVFNYLKNKKENIQQIFLSMKDTHTQTALNDEIGILKNQIHSYNLILFHSINMIISLVEDDLITFYEIYESFDKLNMFNSNWENEVSEKLTNIGDQIQDLMYSINKMETNIIDSVSKLTYVTQKSFSLFSNTVEKQLSGIDSSIKFNNLLSGIQTYQLYKINKGLK